MCSSDLCSCCGEKRYLFGKGGGQRVAQAYAIPFLGEIPLVRSLRESGDEGRPIVVSDPDSEAARAFFSVAERVRVGLSSVQVGHA